MVKSQMVYKIVAKEVRSKISIAKKLLKSQENLVKDNLNQSQKIPSTNTSCN